MNDARVDACAAVSYQCGGPSPVCPEPRSRPASRCAVRDAISSAVSSPRSPSVAGRSTGTEISSSVVHTPCRSGWPHGVRGTDQSFAAAAAVTPAAGP